LQVLVQWFFYPQLLFAKSVTKQAGIKLQICIIEMDHGILDRPDIEITSAGADKFNMMSHLIVSFYGIVAIFSFLH
jgi:hypothetical protein